MNIIRCAIVDDEPFAIELLEDYISRIPQLQLVTTFDNPLQAFQYFQGQPVDLLFLDIEMPELNGMQLSSMLDPTTTKVIFTTAYSAYAAESYDKNALDYLLKPIAFERFLIAVNKIHAFDSRIKFEEKEENIYIKTNGGYRQLTYPEIGFIKAIKDYVMVYTQEKHFIVHHSLKKLEQVLPDSFKRVVHSYIINLKNTSQIKHHHCHIWENKIPISKKYRADIYEEVGKNLL